jgi:thymidylate kinase
LIIIEGIRRSGKTHTIETIKESMTDRYLPPIFYKDKGVPFAMNNGLSVDDYVIGRDLAYAQFLSFVKPAEFQLLVFDRQYLTTYVYGQFYRSNYSKDFYKQHIEHVESFYKEAGLIKKMYTMFIKLKEKDFERIAEMDRKKDVLEDSDIEGYKKQYELYQEAMDITRTNVVELPAFQDENKILEVFSSIYGK